MDRARPSGGWNGRSNRPGGTKVSTIDYSTIGYSVDKLNLADKLKNLIIIINKTGRSSPSFNAAALFDGEKFLYYTDAVYENCH